MNSIQGSFPKVPEDVVSQTTCNWQHHRNPDLLERRKKQEPNEDDRTPQVVPFLELVGPVWVTRARFELFFDTFPYEFSGHLDSFFFFSSAKKGPFQDPLPALRCFLIPVSRSRLVNDLFFKKDKTFVVVRTAFWRGLSPFSLIDCGDGYRRDELICAIVLLKWN